MVKQVKRFGNDLEFISLLPKCKIASDVEVHVAYLRGSTEEVSRELRRTSGSAGRVVAGPACRSTVNPFDTVNREWASAAQEGSLRKGGSNRDDSTKSEAVGHITKIGF